MDQLTGFQRDLLYIIAGLGEPHGLAIKSELEDYYASEIHHGRLYPNLDTLVDAGVVAKGRVDDRTNAYSLTDSGQTLLADRRDWEERHLQGADSVGD